MHAKKINYSSYLYILPSLVIFAVFILYPLIFMIQNSFYEWDGLSPDKKYVGLANFLEIISSGYLPVALKNFIIFGLLTIFIQAFLGLVYAECLRIKMPFLTFFKSIIFLPAVLTPIVIGYVFSNMFEMNFGFINSTLKNVGLDILCQNWTGDPKIALYSIIAVNIWQWTGFSMIMYISGVMSIPVEIYEAADIDGANDIMKFRKITFPLLKSTHFTLTILGAIGALKAFDIIWVLTEGGPGIATSSFSTIILKESFFSYKQGTASALSLILMLCALIITKVQLSIYNKTLK